MHEESILVIDDEPVVLETATAILEQMGHRVETAGSAEEGLELLKRSETAVAICDHFLPGISGIEFFERSLSSHPYLYRILATGERELDLRDAINRAKVHYFLDKPFTSLKLRWAVERVLEQRRHRVQYEALISDLDRLATERAEAAISFERRYRALLDQTRDLVMVVAWEDGAIMEANRRAREILGLVPGQGEARRITELFVAPCFFQDIRGAIEARGRLHGAESALLLPDGKELPVGVAAYSLEDSARGRQILMVFTDLSREVDLQYRLTETHACFRATLDAISDPIFSVDLDRRIVFANDAMASFYGEVPERMAGMSCCEVFGDGTGVISCTGGKGGVECPVEFVLGTGDVYSDRFYCSIGPGERNWWSRKVFPVQGREGSPRQVVMVMRNITGDMEARRRIDALNQELKKAVAKAEAKNERLRQTLHTLKETQGFLLQSEKMASIGQLAAGVAHEINNPVGFITSNLNSLAEYMGDLKELLGLYDRAVRKAAGDDRVPGLLSDAREEIERFKEEIDLDFLIADIDDLIRQSLDGTDRVKRIVADLKDFSHVDRPELEYADINRGLESTLNIVWNELKYKAEVKKDYGELPPLLCYPRQLNQVFMNLLVNAAQAIEDRGVISIVTRRVDSPREGIEVVVSDTGCGMPPDVQKRIFEPFFTTKPVGKGTGLGLNVSYKIVQAHRGEIRVESEVGKGTTFRIFLPFLKEEDFEAMAPEAGPTGGAQEDAP